MQGRCSSRTACNAPVCNAIWQVSALGEPCPLATQAACTERMRTCAACGCCEISQTSHHRGKACRCSFALKSRTIPVLLNQISIRSCCVLLRLLLVMLRSQEIRSNHFVCLLRFVYPSQQTHILLCHSRVELLTGLSITNPQAAKRRIPPDLSLSRRALVFIRACSKLVPIL
jgi:hypothetical protein